MLGLGSSISRSGKVGPTIVRDGLVLKHDYNLSRVQPVSTGAAYFDGADDYIAINAKPVDTADATYCWWSNSTQTDAQVIFGHVGAQYGAFYLNYGTTNKPLFIIHGNTYQYWTDNSFADDGNWHHWALVVDISSMASCKLYCDGVEVDNSTTIQSGDVYDYGNLEIGRVNTSTEFEGYICNFGVWDVHLTQPQIKSIMHKDYASLSDSEKTNLVSWWNLDSVIDSVGASTAVYDNHYAGGSKLGTELVTDGSFANGVASWNEDFTATLSGSSIVFDDDAEYVFQNISYTDGEVYAFTFEGTGDIRSRIGWAGAAATQIPMTLPATIYRLVDSTALRIQVYGASDDSSATLTSVSVKLVNGNTGTLS